MQSRRQILHKESQSLWNYTLSPGWTEKEVQILNLALMKFGIGRWRKILNSNCLPGKSIGQIYMQTQRLLGQQSLGEFMGLSVDMQQVYLANMGKKNVFRKNNSIINTGNNMTQDDRVKRIAENKRLVNIYPQNFFLKYGVSPQFIQQIKLPRYHVQSNNSYLSLEEIMDGKFTTIERINHIQTLKQDIQRKIVKIQTGEIEETFEDDLDISEYQSKKKNRHSYDDEYESSPMTSS